MGSEMCIRDRIKTAQLLAAGRTPGRPEIHQKVFAAPVGQLVGGCLLYTSDAADDLLCVDPGGRRILKKKTPAYNDLLIVLTSQYLVVAVYLPSHFTRFPTSVPS